MKYLFMRKSEFSILVLFGFNNVFFFIALQASALEERLRETEVKLKQNQEEAQTNIQRLNESNSQLVSF